ncbi:hypothetical protein Btru_064391 [Bulinus truncatus]|nr:hypothetical protein Btru_064391 [Bulinus truncatus]
MYRANLLTADEGVCNPELEAEQMIFPEHEESTHLLKSRKNSMTGSVLSLLRRRPSRVYYNHGSEMTLTSQGSGRGRRLSSANGNVLRRISTEEKPVEIRRSSIDIPVRPVKEPEFTKMQRKRKMSLPFQIHLFQKNRGKKTTPILSPKFIRHGPGRSEDTESETFISRAEESRKNFQSTEKISKAPDLSAIEEIKSMHSIPSAISMSRMMAAHLARSGDSDEESDLSDLDIGKGDGVSGSLKENKYSGYMEPPIQEVDEEYVTAYEANSPTFSYLDVPDGSEFPPHNQMGRKRTFKDDGSKRF